jgi:hypothetical protein
VDSLASAELGLLALEFPVGAGDRHPFAGAHPQQVDLEFGEGGEDVEERLAHRVGGVIDRPADGQPDATSGEGVADRSRARDRVPDRRLSSSLRSVRPAFKAAHSAIQPTGSSAVTSWTSPVRSSFQTALRAPEPTRSA